MNCYMLTFYENSKFRRKRKTKKIVKIIYIPPEGHCIGCIWNKFCDTQLHQQTVYRWNVPSYRTPYTSAEFRWTTFLSLMIWSMILCDEKHGIHWISQVGTFVHMDLRDGKIKRVVEMKSSIVKVYCRVYLNVNFFFCGIENSLTMFSGMQKQIFFE